jgi:hypothetical protein
VGGAGVFLDCALELLDLGAEDERLRIGHLFDLSEDLRLERFVLLAEVEERHLHRGKHAARPPQRASGKLRRTRGGGSAGDSLCMESERKNRVDSAVPHPDAAQQLSEAEKRDLERSGEAEHTRGEKPEQAIKATSAAENK